MPLFGYRISQRSVLWPLVAVLLPAWVLIVWLSRNAQAVQELAQEAGPLTPRTLLVVAALLALFSALLLLFRHPWPRFIWAERIQALWPLPLVLLAISLRGVAAQAGKFVVDFINRFIVGALRWEPEPSVQLLVQLNMIENAALALGLVWLVREIVGGRSARLHEILGFDQYDLRDWRLWVVAVGIGLPLGILGGSLGTIPGGFTGLLVVLRLLVLAPFVEGVIYRGFLLSVLKNWCGSWLAALLTSLLYAALQTHLSPSGMGMALVQSVILCFVKIKTQRLAAAMLAHSVMALTGMLLSL